jgi:L,D-transpeptidase catalytic domain
VAGFNRQTGLWYAGGRLPSATHGGAVVSHRLLQCADAACELLLRRLSGPASHGCIRLHPNDAAILFDLVQSQGMRNTTIVVE